MVAKEELKVKPLLILLALYEFAQSKHSNTTLLVQYLNGKSESGLFTFSWLLNFKVIVTYDPLIDVYPKKLLLLY